MNILEIVSGIGLNGAIRHCLLLSRELVRRGHRVMLVCRPEAWIAAEMASSPVEVVPSDLHRFPADELRRIADLARRKRIDVIHTHMSRAHFFGVLLRYLSGVPCVATAHSRHFQLHWMFNNLVIAVSEATRQFHRRWNLVSPRRIVTIHNFVDQPAVSAGDPGCRGDVRRSLGAEASSLLLGAIGDVIPRKGLLYLVRALPPVLAAAPQTRLAVVGRDGPADYVARVKSAARELGVADGILWVGHRGDVPAVLAALDLCVLASIEESFPLAILEAMSVGLPVVATAVGGVPECVRHGETGILVPPADSEALAAALLDLLCDPARRRRFGEAGRRRVLEQFSLESQVARIEAALSSVAHHARSA